jgi:Secretion system C-terminal sorting domain
MPNPANDYVTIKFVADKQTTVTIRLINDIGSTVLQHNQQALKGNNSIQLNNLNKYSKGVYTLQLLVNDEVVSQKLILNR